MILSKTFYFVHSSETQLQNGYRVLKSRHFNALHFVFYMTERDQAQ